MKYKRVILAKLKISRDLVRYVQSSLEDLKMFSDCSEIVEMIDSFIDRCNKEL